jgi:NAD(P)-dependent dehydrogenase (short-subunit alcohol dehydrogenase family)
MQARFEGKVIVVLGASSGIGAATVRRLAEEKATVVLGGVSVDAMRDLVGELRADGTTADYHHADLHDAASIEALINAAVRDHGSLDGLYNNGADLSMSALDGDALSTDLDVFDRVLHANLRGYLLSCRAALPRMLAQGHGTIVQCASIAVRTGLPKAVAYQCSKAGVDALTRHIAICWGKRGIRCNAVAPGVIETENTHRLRSSQLKEAISSATPSPRGGQPEEIAATVAFLLSDDSSFLNGQTVAVDGGMGAGMPPFLRVHHATLT